MHHSVGSYQQGGPGYGPQGGQYGPSGNAPSHLHPLLHSRHFRFDPHILLKVLDWPLKVSSQTETPACGHVVPLNRTGKWSIMCVVINSPCLRSHNVTELPSVSDWCSLLSCGFTYLTGSWRNTTETQLSDGCAELAERREAEQIWLFVYLSVKRIRNLSAGTFLAYKTGLYHSSWVHIDHWWHVSILYFYIIIRIVVEVV